MAWTDILLSCDIGGAKCVEDEGISEKTRTIAQARASPGLLFLSQFAGCQISFALTGYASREDLCVGRWRGPDFHHHSRLCCPA